MANGKSHIEVGQASQASQASGFQLPNLPGPQLVWPGCGDQICGAGGESLRVVSVQQICGFETAPAGSLRVGDDLLTTGYNVERLKTPPEQGARSKEQGARSKESHYSKCCGNKTLLSLT